MKRPLIITMMALVVGVLTAPAAQADSVECTGALTGPVPANVIVPEGATCNLNRADVMGNVEVRPDARLNSTFSTIRGNLGGSETFHVQIFGTMGGSDSVIRGNVQINGSPDVDSNFHTIRDTSIWGNLSFNGNDIRIEVLRTEVDRNGSFIDNGDGQGVQVSQNDIGKNLEVIGNSGLVQVTMNDVGKNLTCKDNQTLVDGGNTVGGKDNCDS